MSANWLSLILAGGSLLGIGFSIKMVNDVFNAEYDICFGIRTFAAKLGRRAMPYSIVAGLFSALCNVHLAIGVFLASFGVRAICKPSETMFKFEPYVDFLVSLALCVTILGPKDGIWAIMVICVVHWVDDIVEMNKDIQSGQRNMAIQFGIAMTLFAILVTLFIAVLLNAQWTVLTFIAFCLLAIFFELTTTELVPVRKSV